MANKPSQAVSAADLATFVNSDSSFAFEMHRLAELNAAGFACQHSGTYSDPVTEKTRQFDIRGRLALVHANTHDKVAVFLAVECKKFDSMFPLLVSATPRRPAESFVDVVHRYPSNPEQVHRASRPVAYATSSPTGRKLDQVGKTDKDVLFSDDSETFDKVQQAVNSCYDLIRDALAGAVGGVVATVVVPVLVVPCGTLWQVTYDDSGALIEQPHLVDRACLFMDHHWTIPGFAYGPIAYSISHLEIVVEGTLNKVADRFLDGNQFPAAL